MKNVQMIESFGFYKAGEVYSLSEQSANNLISLGKAQPTLEENHLIPFEKSYSSFIKGMTKDPLMVYANQMGIANTGKVEELKKRILDHYESDGIRLDLLKEDEIKEIAEKMGIEFDDAISPEDLIQKMMDQDKDVKVAIKKDD